jgi:hypothetical protein
VLLDGDTGAFGKISLQLRKRAFEDRVDSIDLGGIVSCGVHGISVR